jgi:hypothetical protein
MTDIPVDPPLTRPRAASFWQAAIPRCLSVDDAAAYAGCKTVSAFRDWVRRGIMPGPLPGTHRYDRKAIDAALDRLSGLSTTIMELSPYEAWKRHRADSSQGN